MKREKATGRETAGPWSRREFVKQAGTAGAVAWAGVPGLARPAGLDRAAVVRALGRALIPSGPGDPGYRELEGHGITEEVLQGLTALSDELLTALDEGSRAGFGRALVELSEQERETYLKGIVAGEGVGDRALVGKLQAAFKILRLRIYTVYYQNFPENRVPKDNRGVPQTADEHQITNPNTADLVTGWDVAHYPGPVRWEEEQRLRARMKNIFWEEDA